MKIWRTLRSFVFFCSFWRTDFPKFWNYCFVHWGTNSLWRTERVLYFTISRIQHEACSCTFFLPYGQMNLWLPIHNWQNAICSWKTYSLNTSISIQLKSTWKKVLLFFPCEDHTAIKDEPTVKDPCSVSQKQSAPHCSTVVPLMICSR